MGSSRRSAQAPPVSPKAVNASEEFLGQRDDDARRASHVAESVLVLVLDHLADELGAAGAHASDGVVDAFDCKHDAPEAQRVRRCDRRCDLDQFWIAKLRQLEPPVPIRGSHHHDVDLNIFEPVDAVYPRALDRRLAFDRHAERSEKSDSGCKVVNDDADVVQSLDRHVPNIAEAVRGVPRPTVLASWTWLAEETQGDEGAAKLQEGQMDVSPVLARTCGGAGVADLQAPEAVEPGERPFDHPAVASQAVLGLDTTAGDAGDDAALAQGQTEVTVVVTLVGMELVRSATGPAARLGADGLDGVDGGEHHLRIVHV